MMGTDAPIERLRGLLAKATAGPWQVNGCRGKLADLRSGRNEYHLIGPDGDGVAAVFFDTKTGAGFIDAKLLVEAINALPALLARIEATEKLTETVRAFLAKYDECEPHIKGLIYYTQ